MVSIISNYKGEIDRKNVLISSMHFLPIIVYGNVVYGKTKFILKCNTLQGRICCCFFFAQDIIYIEGDDFD